MTIAWRLNGKIELSGKAVLVADRGNGVGEKSIAE